MKSIFDRHARFYTSDINDILIVWSEYNIHLSCTEISISLYCLHLNSDLIY